MPDELPPSLFNIVRDDLRALGDRLDKLVTREAFEAEQRRVDAKMADLGTDIITEQKARADADTEIRTAAAQAALDAKNAQETQQSRKVTLQQGLLTGLVITLAGGVVSLIVVIVQNAAHLG